MKTLLVPTDLSANACNAIDFALYLATKIEAKIIFFSSQHIILPTTTPIRMYEELRDSYLEQYKKELADEINKQLVANNLKENAPDFELIFKNTPNFAEELCETALSNQVDLIVMGTRGADGIKKLFFGSNTVKVIEQASCAVLAIPAEWKDFQCKSIAFATELVNTEAELSKILGLIKDLQSELHIFHIFPNNSEKISASSINPTELASTWQKQFNYPKIKFHLVKSKTSDDPLVGIEAFVEAENSDILITFPQKKSWTDKLFDPSITNALAFKAQIPLLAMK